MIRCGASCCQSTSAAGRSGDGRACASDAARRAFRLERLAPRRRSRPASAASIDSGRSAGSKRAPRSPRASVRASPIRTCATLRSLQCRARVDQRPQAARRPRSRSSVRSSSCAPRPNSSRPRNQIASTRRHVPGNGVEQRRPARLRARPASRPLIPRGSSARDRLQPRLGRRRRPGRAPRAARATRRAGSAPSIGSRRRAHHVAHRRVDREQGVEAPARLRAGDVAERERPDRRRARRAQR